MKKTAPLLVNEDTTQEDGGKIEYAPMVIGEVERNGVTTSWSRIEKSNPSRRRSLQRSYNELVEVFKSPISRRFNRAMSSKGSVQQSVLPPERNKKRNDDLWDAQRCAMLNIFPMFYTLEITIMYD